MVLKMLNKVRELPPEGLHSATFLRIIDIGTQTSEKYGDNRQVVLVFELENRNSKGKRFIVSSFFTNSSHKKAKLRQFLQGFLGPMSDTFAKDFDLESLKDKVCYLNLQHTDGGYANIASIAPISGDAKKISAENDSYNFSINDYPDNEEIFELLPEFLQEKIKVSPEFKEKSEEKKTVDF